MFGLRRRVLVENALRSFAGCEVIENNGDGYARFLEAHSTVHDAGIRSDISFPVHGRLLFTE
jgi:hypothetical protein